MISASGRSPKKLMANFRHAHLDQQRIHEPENGSNRITQENATAITGAT
jgi:hypothetical protein